MNRLAVSVLALALAAAGGDAVAQSQDEFVDGEYPDTEYADDSVDAHYAQGEGITAAAGAQYDVARVLSVAPIVERQPQSVHQECWSEPVRMHPSPGPGERQYGDGYRRTSGAGALLGAIVGGLIGHEISDGNRHRGGHGRRYGYGFNQGRGYRRGHHDDNEVATVAGALIGASIGAGVERQASYRQDAYDHAYQEVCAEAGAEADEERVTGYRVSYEYDGRRYETVTDAHPGNELRVRVQVTPEG